MRRLLGMLFVLLLASPASAAWTPNGNPICTAPGAQTAPAMISDGAGGAILVWADARRGSTTDFYAQRLLADGSTAPGWAADGALVAETPYALNHQAVTDGTGGAFVFWFQYAGGLGIYAQHLLSDGSRAPGWPANGRLITADFGAPAGMYLQAATDGSGGAYLARTAADGSMNSHLRLTRLTSAGAFATGWTEAGVDLLYIGQGDGLGSLSLISDGIGGAILEATYYWSFGPPSSRYSSAVSWVSPSGAVTFVTTPGPGSIASDEAGGCFVTGFNAPLQGFNYFGRHFASSTSSLWTADPAVPLRGVPCADGAGGVYVAGSDAASAFTLIRRTSNGSVPAGWSGSGFALGASPVLDEYALIRAGTSAVVSWIAPASGDQGDVYALIVRDDGTLAPGWSAGGTALCNATGWQRGVRLVSDGAGGAFACWQDPRTDGAAPDIYATRLVPDGPVPALASVATASGFADHAELRWYADAANEAATVQRSDDGAAWTDVGDVSFDEEGFASFTDGTVEPGRRYGYRLFAAGSAVWPGSETWIEIPGALAFGVRSLSPNPASSSVTVSFALAGDEPATLELLDVSGRMLQRLTVSGRAALELQRTISLQEVPRGLYWVRLTQGARTHSQRLARVN